MLQKIAAYERENNSTILENKARRDTEMRTTELRIKEELDFKDYLAKSIKVIFPTSSLIMY